MQMAFRSHRTLHERPLTRPGRAMRAPTARRPIQPLVGIDPWARAAIQAAPMVEIRLGTFAAAAPTTRLGGRLIAAPTVRMEPVFYPTPRCCTIISAGFIRPGQGNPAAECFNSAAGPFMFGDGWEAARAYGQRVSSPPPRGSSGTVSAGGVSGVAPAEGSEAGGSSVTGAWVGPTTVIWGRAL